MGACIEAICFHLPEKKLTNDMLASELGNISAEDIYKLSGIKKRHIAKEDETPSDLAFGAAEKIFSSHTTASIDALIYCTEGLDYKAPASACLLHHRLGLKPSCLALDIPGGCTGFVNGLLVAKSLIAANSAIDKVLLLTAETVSKVLHPEDANLRMLFGDAACATLLSRSNHDAIGQFVAGTDGSRAKTLWVEHSGFDQPADMTWLAQHQSTPNGMKYGRLIMEGAELLHFSLTCVPTLVRDTLAANHLEECDINLYIFHQASKIILKSLKRKCHLPDDKFFLCLEDFGNTVSSSIPLALYHALQERGVAAGDKIMLVGFGVGLSWSATVMEISKLPEIK